ncbi:MAG: hypothetical protein WAV93_11450 [Bacteroidales bacterium]
MFYTLISLLVIWFIANILVHLILPDDESKINYGNDPRYTKEENDEY